MTQAKPPKRGRGKKVAATAGVVGILAAAAGWLLGLFGLGPDLGTGSGDKSVSPGQENPPAEIQPEDLSRPMVVEIRGHDYYVKNQKVSRERLVELAKKVPQASEENRGPAVLIHRDATSRAAAENALIEALDTAGIRHAMEQPSS
jgi:hypothetical protein